MYGLTGDEARWLCEVLNGIPQPAHGTLPQLSAVLRKTIEDAAQPHGSQSNWNAVRDSVRHICEGLDENQTCKLVEAVKRLWKLNAVPTDDELRSVGLING